MSEIVPQDDAPYNHCKKCGKDYPYTPQYWPIEKRRKSGLGYPCKQCRHAIKAGYHARRTPEQREKRIQYNLLYKATHKEEIKEAGHRYYLENKEECLERRRIDRARYLEKRQAYERQYYLNNKARHQENERRYRVAHPESGRTRANRRRAQKLAAPGSHTAQQIQEQYRRQKGRCYYCRQKVKEYHIDHVIPLSRGGSNDISNLVIACPTCNDSKGTRLPHEWPLGGRLL